MEDAIDWSEWYDITRDQPPNQLLVDALSYVKNTGKVLDIGGGALKDTRFLLKNGFDVTVIDKSPLLKKEVEKIKNEKLHSFVTSFENFQFPVDEYVLISAMHSLSYCKSEHFDHVIANIKKSLKKGGIFCGQIYDAYSQWSEGLRGRHKTYKTENEIMEYLRDMEIILFKEEETDKGRTKHWRIYDFIARRPYR